MSVEANTAAWNVEGLNPAERLVLLCLADHADEHGERCYPSLVRVGRRTGLSRSTVIRCVGQLEKAHHVVVHRESRQPNQYVVQPGGVRVQSQRIGVTVRPHTDEIGVVVNLGGCRGDTRTVIEPLEPFLKEGSASDLGGREKEEVTPRPRPLKEQRQKERGPSKGLSRSGGIQGGSKVKTVAAAGGGRRIVTLDERMAGVEEAVAAELAKMDAEERRGA